MVLGSHLECGRPQVANYQHTVVGRNRVPANGELLFMQYLVGM